MNINFIGTAAFEGFPGLFCSCKACALAMSLKGKNLRTRSGVIINENLLVDVNPDLLQQRFTQGIDLQKIKDVLVTHHHEDHFNPQLLLAHMPPFCDTEETLHIYATAPTVEAFNDMINKNGHTRLSEHVILHQIAPGEWFETSTGYKAFAIEAQHSATDSVIYLIKNGNKDVLYGTDTGTPADIAFEQMQTALGGKHLDMAILDCTNGLDAVDYFGHMGLPENLEMKDKMISLSIAGKNTIFISTHFSHNLGKGATHQQMEDEFGKHEMLVAFDGLEMQV